MLRHLIDEFTILKLFCELNTDLLYYEDYEFDKITWWILPHHDDKINNRGL